MTDTILYVIIGVVLSIIIVTLIILNSLVRTRDKVNEAFSKMDVYLKRRWALIPSLVETVKGYVEHEKTILEEIIRLRNTTYDNMDVIKKVRVGDELKKRISKLMMMLKNNPELKANENFSNLSKNLDEVEKEIENSRKYYDDCVRKYNDKVERFPSNVIAKIFRF